MLTVPNWTELYCSVETRLLPQRSQCSDCPFNVFFLMWSLVALLSPMEAVQNVFLHKDMRLCFSYCEWNRCYWPALHFLGENIVQVLLSHQSNKFSRTTLISIPRPWDLDFRTVEDNLSSSVRVRSLLSETCCCFCFSFTTHEIKILRFFIILRK